MIRFRVYGIPQTKGSVKALWRPGMRRPILTNDNPKNKGWAATVAGEAQLNRPLQPFQGAVCLTLVFTLPRPQSLPKHVTQHTKRPDLDKMVRSVKDALTGVMYRDDAQVVELVARKDYGLSPGVLITIKELS